MELYFQGCCGQFYQAHSFQAEWVQQEHGWDCNRLSWQFQGHFKDLVNKISLEKFKFIGIVLLHFDSKKGCEISLYFKIKSAFTKLVDELTNFLGVVYCHPAIINIADKHHIQITVVP